MVRYSGGGELDAEEEEDGEVGYEGAELGDENPEVVEGEAVALVVFTNPALNNIFSFWLEGSAGSEYLPKHRRGRRNLSGALSGHWV